jgi:hypothetical protein
MAKYKRPMKEKIKLLLCVLMFLFIISFTLAYFVQIGMFDSDRQNPDVEFGKLINAHASHDKDDLFAKDMFLPEFIGLSPAGKKRQGIVGSADAISELYGEIETQLADVLQSGEIVSATEDDFISSLDKESIYLRYFDSVPLSFICSAASNFDFCPKYEYDPNVKEIVISYDDSSNALIYFKTPTGGVYRTDSQCDISLSVDELLARMGDSNLSRFEFVFESARSDELGPYSDTQPLVLDPLLRMGIDVSFYESAWETPSDSELLRGLLAYYGFSADKLNSYYEGQSLVSLQTHGSIKLSPTSFSYTAYESEGIELGEYLDYITDSRLDLVDEYRAVMIIANQMSRMFDDISGVAELSLVRLRQTESGLSAKFGYSYSNMPIIDSSVACVIETSDGKLVRADFCYYSAKLRVHSQSIYSGEWLAYAKLKQLGRTDDFRYLEMSLAYYVNDREKTVSPDWKVKGLK